LELDFQLFFPPENIFFSLFGEKMKPFFSSGYASFLAQIGSASLPSRPDLVCPLDDARPFGVLIISSLPPFFVAFSFFNQFLSSFQHQVENSGPSWAFRDREKSSAVAVCTPSSPARTFLCFPNGSLSDDEDLAFVHSRSTKDALTESVPNFFAG